MRFFAFGLGAKYFFSGNKSILVVSAQKQSGIFLKITQQNLKSFNFKDQFIYKYL